MVKVNPADLRFTQESIGSHFKDPPQYSVRETIKHIQGGQMKPDDFPMLHVMVYNGCLWSLDNRRLWVFRMVRCSEITVRVVTQMHSRLEAIVNDQSLCKKLSNAEFLPRVRGKGPNVKGISSNRRPKVQDAKMRWVAIARSKSPQWVLRETIGNRPNDSFLPPPNYSQGRPVLVNVSNEKAMNLAQRPLLHPQGRVSVDTTTSVRAKFPIPFGSLHSNGNEQNELPVLPTLSQSLGWRDSALYKSSNVDIMRPLLLNGARSSQVGGRTSNSGDQLTSVHDGRIPKKSTFRWGRFFRDLLFGCFGSRY